MSTTLREAVSNARALLERAKAWPTCKHVRRDPHTYGCLDCGGAPSEDEWKSTVEALVEATSATPPAVTHAALAALVEQVAREGEQQSGFARGPEDDFHGQGMTFGAREVLRRVTGGQVLAARLGPPPPVGDLADLLTLLDTPSGDSSLHVEAENGRTYDVDGNALHAMVEKAAKWDAACDVNRQDEAGEVAREAFDAALARREHAAAMYLAVTAGIRFVLGLTLPTDPGTGETKTCASTLEDCHGVSTRACGRCDAHCGHARGICAEPTQRARIPTPTPDSPPLVQPEPAAPEVAWQGDGVRVLADGWWTHDGRHTHNVSVAGVLARALAEATREREEYADVAGKALASAVVEAAQLAAQDMRERAEEAVLSGPVDETPTRGELAGRIRALSLTGAPAASALPSFRVRPLGLREEPSGRHALHLEVNGVEVDLVGDYDDKASRHLLCYLFTCPELRLQVVRESSLVHYMGRPAVTAPRTEGGRP